MRVTTWVLGSLETNCYILAHNGLAVVVDAGENPEPMLEALEERELRLTHILLTHLHADHVCGVRRLQQETLSKKGVSPEIWGSAADLYLQKLIYGRGGQWLPRVPAFTFSALKPGRQQVLEQPLLVLDTPGHTPGGLSFYFPRSGVIFVGDLLFQGSVGRTDWPGGDAQALLRSIRERIFILPDETVVYSGHGPATTVGREKETNPFFAA